MVCDRLLVMQQFAACEGRRAGSHDIFEREDAHADGLKDPQAPAPYVWVPYRA